MARRSHSTIDKLPAELKADIDSMLIDNDWPDGFDGPDDWQGNPRYEDVVEYAKLKGHSLSLSAVGRYGQRVKTLARMKRAGLIAREAMSGLDDSNASQTQKAAAEMITAHMIELVSNSDQLNALEIKNVSTAIKNCTDVAVKADEYIRQRMEAKAKVAVGKVEEIARKQQIDAETLKIIKEQIYGIVEK